MSTITATTTNHTHRWRFARLLVSIAATAALTLLASVASPDVGSAQAITWGGTGSYGATDSWTPTYVNAAPSYPVNSRVIAGPTVRVFRNGAVATNNPQVVIITGNLYRATSSGWVLITSKSNSYYIQGGYSAANLMVDSLGSWARGYSYYVSTMITWKDNYGNVSGTLTVNPNQASDNVCTVSYCTPSSSGYVTIR